MITGLLKSPLMYVSLHQSRMMFLLRCDSFWLLVSDEEHEKDRIGKYSTYIHSLPKISRSTLAALLQHLYRYTHRQTLKPHRVQNFHPRSFVMSSFEQNSWVTSNSWQYKPTIHTFPACSVLWSLLYKLSVNMLSHKPSAGLSDCVKYSGFHSNCLEKA